MKRILFVVLIVVVLSITGFCAWQEFSVKEIVYVNDKVVRNNSKGNDITIYRLYNSGVDIDEFYASIQAKIVNTEFEDEEIEQAALSAGIPELYETFTLSLINENNINNGSNLRFSVIPLRQIAKGQDETNFKISNLRLEAKAYGVTFNETYEIFGDENEKSSNVPVLKETDLFQPADGALEFGFYINGEEGSITLSFIYDIVTESLFTSTVLTDQLLYVTVNISKDEEGLTVVEMIPEKYDSIEDLTE